MDWEDNATAYILEILGEEVLPIEDVLSEIPNAPSPIRRRLVTGLRNLKQLEEFLQKYEELFIVENGKVAAYDPDLVTGREKAVDYFENELKLYDEPPNYMNFRGHIGQAEDEVIDFINGFYPKDEFKNFLNAHPEVFVVFDDDTVFLIENESVDYFEECLEKSGDGLYFTNLRGHIGQAPSYVIEFINTEYPGESFLDFLENNSDVFTVNDGYVFLNHDDED